jgi:hypothetical protein
MSYVSIMTAFELGNPVLLAVLVKTHDAPIHRELQALANEADRWFAEYPVEHLLGASTRDPALRRMVMDRSPASRCA